MIREEINRIGENGWSESIMPHMNRAGCFDDFKTAYDELREEFRCAQLECELLGVTGVQISSFLLMPPIFRYSARRKFGFSPPYSLKTS